MEENDNINKNMEINAEKKIELNNLVEEAKKLRDEIKLEKDNLIREKQNKGPSEEI